MYIQILMALALLLPAALWLRWRQTNKISYQGPAEMLGYLPSGLENQAYVVLRLPGRANHSIVLVTKPADENKYLGATVSIVEQRRLLGRPRISDINWTGEKFEPAEQEFGAGLFVTLLYISLALGFAVLTSKLGLGRFGYLSCAFALAMSGSCANLYRFTPTLVRQSPMRLLGFSLGKGTWGLGVGAVLLAVATVACFWQASIFMFFPGINLAFELGGIAAMLMTAVSSE